LGWGDGETGRLGDSETGGWEDRSTPIATRLEIITARVEELEPFFLSRKKRQGGERAGKTAKLWAQIIARLEMGDALRSIATDLNIPYDTVKKYAQTAKQHLASEILAIDREVGLPIE
jgi:CRISPR-associated endoribonuclease Cas6